MAPWRTHVVVVVEAAPAAARLTGCVRSAALEPPDAEFPPQPMRGATALPFQKRFGRSARRSGGDLHFELLETVHDEREAAICDCKANKGFSYTGHG